MSNKNKNRVGVVYSTNPDFQYTDKDDLIENEEGASKGSPKVWLDRKGGNKVVSRISDLNINLLELANLKKDLQGLCGSGGSVKDGEILIQGDHRDKILAFLLKEGYKAKKAGG